jgi:choline kinase
LQAIENVVIPCAGYGSRLGLDIPKCLVEIDGKSLIRRNLELTAGFDRVFVIVGFKEHEVIRAATAVRDDVIFVRNPDYRTTGNLHSLQLVTRHLRDGFILIDGDLLIEKDGFEAFCRQAQETGETLVSVTPAGTEEALYVRTRGDHVEDFSFTEKTEYEWPGLAYIHDPAIFARDLAGEPRSFVFTRLKKVLPLRYHETRCYEIDTPRDLQNAIEAYRDTRVGSRSADPSANHRGPRPARS